MPSGREAEGLRVLVTAASQGIGFAAARAVLRAGARVAVNSSHAGRRASAIDRLRPDGTVEGIVADLQEGPELDRLAREAAERLGGIDTLVYVTGSPPPGALLELDHAAWEEAARLLTVSPAYLGRRVAERMISEGTGGRLVFLSSFAVREPVVALALSSVCRSSVTGLVRLLARDLGPRGIRTNGILPGYIETDRLRAIVADDARRRGRSPEEARADLEREVPLGRIGTPEELARAILFLGTEMSSYVNGALLPVDGGLLRSVG